MGTKWEGSGDWIPPCPPPHHYISYKVAEIIISMRAFVVFSNGKNGTIGRQIPFKVLPMVPLVMPTNVTNIRQQMVQTEYSVGNSTNAGKVT